MARGSGPLADAGASTAAMKKNTRNAESIRTDIKVLTKQLGGISPLPLSLSFSGTQSSHLSSFMHCIYKCNSDSSSHEQGQFQWKSDEYQDHKYNEYEQGQEQHHEVALI